MDPIWIFWWILPWSYLIMFVDYVCLHHIITDITIWLIKPINFRQEWYRVQTNIWITMQSVYNSPIKWSRCSFWPMVQPWLGMLKQEQKGNLVIKLLGWTAIRFSSFHSIITWSLYISWKCHCLFWISFSDSPFLSPCPSLVCSLNTTHTRRQQNLALSNSPLYKLVITLYWTTR